MKQRSSALTLAVCLFLLASVTTVAIAQDALTAPQGKFVVLPAKPGPLAPPPASLATWSSSFKNGTHTDNFTMVGTNPATSNTTTTIPVYIIPVKIVVKGTTYDPGKVLSNGLTTITATTSSPVFQNVHWVQGGTDLGTTQYLDAYQRGNFWTNVMTNTNYHVVLGTPTVLATQTLNVPTHQGTTGSPFGFKTGIVNINWFDTQANNIIKANSQITANSIPIFVTYNTYLSDNSGLSGCCIGGYHSATGSQTYMHYTYIDHSSTFASDISALSHEVGEWYDDPLVNNLIGGTGCSGYLENGDPLEGLSNYGTFAVTLNGITWHPQDLVFLKYFGQNPSTSVNNWWTFNNSSSVTKVCQYGQ